MPGDQDDRRVGFPRRPPEAEFAHLLGESLDRRGLTLTRARELLAGRGESVSLATLSYWRSGQRVPEGSASLDVLDCLDDILRLPAGTLRRSLGPSRRPGFGTADFVEPESLLVTSDAAREALRVLDLTTAMQSYVEQSVAVAVDVDHRGQEVRCTVRTRLRAIRDGVARCPLVLEAGAPLEETLTIAGLWGCRIGRTHLDLPVGLMAYELLLERPLRLGETVLIGYDLLLPDTAEPETDFSWHVPRRASEVEVWVRFDPQRLPITAQVGTHPVDGDSRTSEVDLSGTTAVSHTARRFGPGTLSVTWTW